MKHLTRFVLLLSVLLSVSGGSWLLIPGGAAPITPDSFSTKSVWFRYDSKATSGSNVTQWTQKSTDLGGVGVSMNFSGTFPQVVPNALNGHDGIAFASGMNKNITSPTNSVTVGPSQPFTWAIVHKAPTLSANTYYSINGMSANSNPDNIAVFYTALVGLPVYYIQIGQTTTTVVSPTDFDPSSYHFIIVTYNGGGNYATAGNWKIYLNGVSQTVSTQSLTGSSSAINFFGDNAGGGSPDAGITLEYLQMMEEATGSSLTGLIGYFQTQYGL